MNECALLECLLPYLTLGEIGRLHRALGPDPAWPAELFVVVQHRLQLTTPILGWEHVAYRLLRRCCECGAPTRCVPRICQRCWREDDNFRAVLSRHDIRRMAREGLLASRHLERRIRADLSVVKRSIAGGAYLYWKRDVLRVLAP